MWVFVLTTEREQAEDESAAIAHRLKEDVVRPMSKFLVIVDCYVQLYYSWSKPGNCTEK